MGFLMFENVGAGYFSQKRGDLTGLLACYYWHALVRPCQPVKHDMRATHAFASPLRMNIGSILQKAKIKAPDIVIFHFRV